MANLIINWVLPTARESGRPLPVSEIRHVSLGLGVAAAGPFTPLGDFLPNVLTNTVEDLAAGDWTVRATVTDIRGKVSKATIASDYADESAPGQVTLTLTLV